MSLFGNLAQISLFDVANVLQTSQGILHLPGAWYGKSIDLCLERGEIRHMLIEGSPAHDVSNVTTVIRFLLQEKDCDFEFLDRTYVGEMPFRLDFRQLLAALAQETVNLEEDELPHEDTVFISVAGARSIPPSLETIYRDLLPALAQGCTARELTSFVYQYSLPEARHILFRLRAAGLIEPFRISEPLIVKQMPPPAQPAVPVPAPRTAPVPTPNIAFQQPIPTPHVPVPDPVPAAPVQAPAPRAATGTFGRLLGALKRFTLGSS